AYGSVVGNDALPFGRRPQQRSRLMSFRMGRIGQSRLERQRPLRPRHFPEGQMPVAAQRGECAGSSQGLEVAAIERRASRQILNAIERLRVASIDEAIRTVTRKRLDESQAQTQRWLFIFPPLQGAIPNAHTDVHRTDFHAVRPCVSDKLRWRVETHGLTVEQRRCKCRLLM